MAVAAPEADAYPVRVGLEAPLEVARWRPLVHWLLAIPHWFVLTVVSIVSGFAVIIAWFAILFTGRIPRGLFDFMVMVYRYSWRVVSYTLWMREPYPEFTLPMAAEDPGGDPAWMSVDYPERLSRLLIFVKWLLVLPHVIVLYLLFIAQLVVIVIAWFVVLITGRYPQALREFMVGATRWYMRANAYANLLTDAYPPFALR